MSDDERRERCRQLCRVLAKWVGEKTSPGLGQWDEAWRIVEAESNDFLDALAHFTTTGHESYMERAKALACDVLGKWQEAEAAYQREQRLNRKARLHAGQHS